MEPICVIYRVDINSKRCSVVIVEPCFRYLIHMPRHTPDDAASTSLKYSLTITSPRLHTPIPSIPPTQSSTLTHHALSILSTHFHLPTTNPNPFHPLPNLPLPFQRTLLLPRPPILLPLLRTTIDSSYYTLDIHIRHTVYLHVSPASGVPVNLSWTDGVG